MNSRDAFDIGLVIAMCAAASVASWPVVLMAVAFSVWVWSRRPL